MTTSRTTSTSTSTSTSSTTSTTGLRYVSLSMKVLNVNYASLVANPSMASQFAEKIKDAVVLEAAAGMLPEDVEVFLSAGSVAVQANIEPASSVTGSLIFSRLQASTTLVQTVEAKVSAIPGI